MVPASIERFCERHLGAVPREGSGSTARIDGAGRPLFVKWDRAGRSRIRDEADGLEALRAVVDALRIPEVVELGETADGAWSVLVIERVEQGRWDEDAWSRLGQGLARLHRTSAADREPEYGYGRDNWIGEGVQRNDWRAEWPRFFREMRLAPQVEWARSQERWEAGWDRPLERLFDTIASELPGAPSPALVHGDLWSGNVLVDREGDPWLIDPAVYYGHREVDLAMSELFGGFGSAFYSSYQETWPLGPGYERRREIYNLYHLINHLNIFGSGYAGRVKSILRRYA